MRLLLTGAGGQLGSEIARLVAGLNEKRARARVALLALDHSSLDVSSRDQVLSAVLSFEPDVVIHAAALTAVDSCELEPERAYSVNALGTRNVAEAARLNGSHLVYLSTDYVFDGRASRPYLEWDEPAPISVYGRSKLGGERELDGSHTVIRTAWVMGRTGSNMARTVLRLGRQTRGELRFVDDQRGSPTVASDLAAKVLELATARRPGLFHVTNQGEATWFEVARQIMAAAGLDKGRVVPISTGELDPPRPAARPANSVLENAALRLSGDELLPDWRESLDRLVAEIA
jgi:dTDP-4-dehydrorhamnose reductase